MRLRIFRDDGTMGIPFRIEKAGIQGEKKSKSYFRVVFAFKYPVDLYDCYTYAEVIEKIQKEYFIANLNFDTVELC